MTIKLDNVRIIGSASTSTGPDSEPLIFEVGPDSVRIENCFIVSRDRAVQLGLIAQLEPR